VSAHRSRSIGRNEAADFDIAAKTDIPNDGFAKRVSGVSNDRLFRHLPPQTIDWNSLPSLKEEQWQIRTARRQD
jgi:hypothetical protein